RGQQGDHGNHGAREPGPGPVHTYPSPPRLILLGMHDHGRLPREKRRKSSVIMRPDGIAVGLGPCIGGGHTLVASPRRRGRGTTPGERVTTVTNVFASNP